jgi:hypothetical protein
VFRMLQPEISGSSAAWLFMFPGPGMGIGPTARRTTTNVIRRSPTAGVESGMRDLWSSNNRSGGSGDSTAPGAVTIDGSVERTDQ